MFNLSLRVRVASIRSYQRLNWLIFLSLLIDSSHIIILFSLCRYNGYMLPLTNDKPASKVRKLSPKKKNAPTDMVTATGKPAVKRRSKVKNCVNSDGIVNGFLTPSAPIATSSNTPTKTKCDFNPYAECFDASPFPSKFNNFIRPKPHPAAANSANHLAAKLANKDGDVELNRKRVAHSGTNNVSHVGSIGSSSKYDMLNHARPDELNHLRPGEPSSSSKASYPRAPQPNHASGEVPSKTSPNNLSSRNKVATSYLQMSVKSSGSRVDEVREKESEYRNYLPNAALAAPSATVKPEARFLDSRRAELQHQQLLDDVRMSEASSSVGTVSSKLFLRAKRWKQSRNKWQMDSGTRHEALQRIREGLDVHDKLLNDLFPLSKRYNFHIYWENIVKMSWTWGAGEKYAFPIVLGAVDKLSINFIKHVYECYNCCYELIALIKIYRYSGRPKCYSLYW